MPFKGSDPYGTAGGQDLLSTPNLPPDVRIVEGGSYVGYLLVNGPITERLREQIEQVVRTLGARGQGVVALIVREDAAVIDSNATDIDFRAGIRVVAVSPGIVYVEIPANGITTAMLQDSLITAAKMANDSVSTAQLVNGAVTPAKLQFPAPQMVAGSSGVTNTYAATTDVQSVNVPVSAGKTYRMMMFGMMHAEGAGGTIGAGNIRLTIDGVINAEYNNTFEQGVNAPGIIMGNTDYVAGITGNIPVVLSWIRTSGSITVYARWLYVVFWPLN